MAKNFHVIRLRNLTRKYKVQPTMRSPPFDLVTVANVVTSPEFPVQELSSSEIASLIFSFHELGRTDFRIGREKIFNRLIRMPEEKLEGMTATDLGRFAVAFGFLVKEFGCTGDHTRIGELILKNSVKHLSHKVVDSRILRNLIKGLSLCRLPGITKEMKQMYNIVCDEHLTSLSQDEQIYLLRSMTDYGIVDYPAFEYIIDRISNVRPKSAASLLYSCAMVKYQIKEETAVMLLNACNLDPCEPKSLIPLWAMKILGYPVPDTQTVHALLKNGLESSDPRDYEMASTISGIMHVADRNQALTQSAKHIKLVQRIEKEFGKHVIYEYMVTPPGVSVDCAVVDRRIAIEIHGPSHFLVHARTNEKIMNGPTQFKSNLLKSHGWEVLHISV